MILWDVYCVDDSSRLWLLGDVVDEMTRTLSCRNAFKVFVKQTQMYAQKRTHKHMHACMSQREPNTTIHFRLYECYRNITNKQTSERKRGNELHAKGGKCVYGSAPVVCLRRRRNFHFRKISPEFRTSCGHAKAWAPPLHLCAVHMQHECVHNWADWCQCISFFSRSNMSSINFLFHLLSEIRIRVV